MSSYLDFVNDKYVKQLSGKFAEEEENESDSDEESEKKYERNDAFADKIAILSREICWLTGSLAHGLIEVKSEVIDPDKAKKEKEQEKMERLLMDSKLLSGGIENRHMNIFSKKTKDQMMDILSISGDNTLLELLTVADAKNEDDELMLQAIHAGRNENVDWLIEALQHKLLA